MRTYYASCEYENEAEPGEYAAITIIGDDDGPHLVFSTGEVVILDLPIPACEALAVSYALARAGKHAIVAAEHLTERLADLRTAKHVEPQPSPLEPGTTSYGPREVRREPDPRSLPLAHQDQTRALPVTTYSPPAAWVGGVSDIPRRQPV